MTGNSDLIENPVELADNIIDLGGQVACINAHFDSNSKG